MTEDQKYLREERIAIMTVEGVSQKEAEKYCDDNPHIFGYRDQEETQGKLL